MRRGLSLLETVFAGLLACIVFFVIMSLYPSALFSLRKGHDMVCAANLARRNLESLRASSFDSLVDGTRTLPDASVDGTRFSTVVTVESLRTDLKRLVTRVSWNASGRTLASGVVELETRVYRFSNR